MTEPQQPGEENQDFQLPPPGSIAWQDLTVPNAPEIRDFYCQVVGWTYTDHDMGDYADYNINLSGSGQTVAGICHARDSNANIPPQWLVYIVVEDVAQSAQKCVELGGKLIDGPRDMGGQTFCVIQDPAGAVAALIGG
ncbi:MAG: VOC family protein [Chloroflexi bacterium]|nr:VOC family protein [Chloroflexota bacterium]